MECRTGPAGGAAVAPLVHGDAVVTRFGDGGQDFPPGESEFGVAVAEKEERVAGPAGLEDMEVQAASSCAIYVVFRDGGGEWKGLKKGIGLSHGFGRTERRRGDGVGVGGGAEREGAERIIGLKGSGMDIGYTSYVLLPVA